MEKELNRQEKSITDTWTLTNENFDKDVLLSTLIMKGGTFEPLYSNPTYFYTMCAMFWRKWSRTFEKWFDALDIEYNPLENYDRQEEWHEDIVDDGSTTFSDEKSSSNTEVVDDDATTSSTSDTDNTTTNTVSAFDSSSYLDHDKSVSDTSITDSGSSTDDRTTTTTYSEESENSGTNTNDRDLDHEGRIHGNIGVTTSQQMLEAELKIDAWNVYEHMSDIFCSDMLITVF